MVVVDIVGITGAEATGEVFRLENLADVCMDIMLDSEYSLLFCKSQTR